MNSAGQYVVFFDLVDTLGAEWASWKGRRMARFLAYPDIRAHLEALRPGARLGVLVIDPSLTDADLERALAETYLEGLIDPSLVILARPDELDPKSPETDPFTRALRKAGLEDAPKRAAYVSLQAALRERAHQIKMRVAPHPAFAREVLKGEELHYVRVAAPDATGGHSWAPVIRDQPIVPLLSRREDEPVLYAIAAAPALESLGALFAVEEVGKPSDVVNTTLYLLQMTKADIARSARLQRFLKDLPGRLPVAKPVPGGYLVAVPGAQSIDEFHPPDVGPGHNLVLLPSHGPSEEPEPNGGPGAGKGPAGKVSGEDSDPGEGPGLTAPGKSSDGGGQAALMASGGVFAPRPLNDDEKTELAELDAALLQGYLEPCCGKQPWATPAGEVSIESRHIHHAGNEYATEWLAAAFEQIFGVEPLLHHVSPNPTTNKELWNVVAEIEGKTSELVIVGAHLDSTAKGDVFEKHPFHYRPDVDPAPGADDDASGVAGVLAAATVLKALSDDVQPQHTIRFLLFNKEEQGMWGSFAYANALEASNETVLAMIQMDMIGWVSGSHPTGSGFFEVHGAGEMDFEDVYQAANQLASLVVAVAAQVSPDLLPQQYPLPEWERDPAAGRSDHMRFLFRDWPACLVSEDLFGEADEVLSSLPKNTAYHTMKDVDVNLSYAAAVARAVAGTAWMVASQGTGP